MQHRKRSTRSYKTKNVVLTGGVAAGGRGVSLPGGSGPGSGSWPGFEETPNPSSGGGRDLVVLATGLWRDSEQQQEVLLRLQLPGDHGLLHQLQTRLPQ